MGWSRDGKRGKARNSCPIRHGLKSYQYPKCLGKNKEAFLVVELRRDCVTCQNGSDPISIGYLQLTKWHRITQSSISATTPRLFSAYCSSISDPALGFSLARAIWVSNQEVCLVCSWRLVLIRYMRAASTGGCHASSPLISPVIMASRSPKRVCEGES